MSPVCCDVPAKWIRLVCLVVFFAVVLSSLPVHLQHDSANAQGSSRRRTQGPPNRNLPNLDDARGIEPGTPRIMPPVPATKCRGRDEKCKKAKGKISDNLPDNQDRLLAHDGHRSVRDYARWLNSGIPALSMLAYMIYWPARMISDFPDIPYRDRRSALVESAVKLANPRNETYGGAASRGLRKGYSRSARPLAAAQSSGVVTVNPGSYQTPVFPGDYPVSSPSNTGYEQTFTPSSAYAFGGYGSASDSAARSARWSAFQSVSGTIVSIRLKFNWSVGAFASASADGNGGSASSSCSFGIEYSLDGGSSWIGRVYRSVSASGNDYQILSDSGSEDILLSAGQNITQVQVRTVMSSFADATGGEFLGSESQTNISTSISTIRIEVEKVDCIASVPADRWKGEYFNNQTLSGSPTMVRDDGAGFLNVNFGGGSPHSICAPAADNFSARWTRTVNFASGVYRFTAAVDNGVALYVDGQLKISQWGNLPPNTYTADVFLSEGNHEIRLEFVEYTGGASASLSWAVVCQTNVAADRWKGEYYNNNTLAGAPAMVRDDGAGFLNLNFGGASPGSACGLGADNFSARWTRTVNFAAGTYHFTATVDNGLRLYVDGQLKITQWADLPPNTYTADVALTAGNHEIKLEFVEYTGGASASLSWATSTVGDLSMALIDPNNSIGSPGKDLLSRNCNWSLPLLSLRGRAGMDLGLALSLNSLVYARAGSSIYFDPDQGYPATGFRLGFPEIRNAFINTDSGIQSYLLSMPSGRRVEFRQINTNVYEAVDSSYMLLTHDPVNSVFILHTTDGTQCRFEDVTGLGDYKCKQIKDRQGNFITIGYGSLAEIRTVTDTLGRVINFNYDVFNHLISITQNWGGQTHTWATFSYGTQTIQTNFPGLTLNGTTNEAQESVLLRVGLADGTIYSFEYNTYAQVKTIRRYAPNNSNPVNFPGDYFQRAYTTYGLPDNAADPQTDCPRATSRTDWAYDWNPGVTSTYAADPGHAWGQVTFPDGTIYKEFFATTGWQRGLTTQTENWTGGVRKKWTTLQWTQDNTGVSYKLNPRVTETNVYDDADNRRRTTMNYTSFGLVSDVYEYDANATTVLRHTHTDYNLSAVYTSRRIIGLPSAKFLYDGGANLFSKVDYQYDLGGGYQVHQGPPVQHDTPNYGAGFVQGRGNLNVVRRWDVTDPDNTLQVSEYETGYNTSGSVIFARDPLDHQKSVSYADSFSDGQNNRNTYAYPTTMTDPDNFSSTVQYNYDFGAVTRAQDPKGAVVTRTYDAAGRIEQITNMVNGAYTRYVYRPDQREVETYTTVNDLNPANEVRSVTVFDGLDRVRLTVSDHPTSVGQYKAQYKIYDVMGRLAQQSNPAEVNSSRQPAGDDVAGWVWSSQAYDWQGRTTVSTDQEGNTMEFLYGGCGCAGGQVVVTRDEVGRRQKMTYDILGRLKTTQALFTQPKSQPLNGDGDVYSTQVNTYNVRDQITQVSQIAQSGGASQITTMQYDGHGRLWKQKKPIESGDTVYEYNADDTVFRITDARQAAATFTYYARHLIQDISYTVPAGIAATPNVHYAYDENGNRILMNDGLGTVNYSYDSLSRMESETRYFSELARSYSLTYAYNLAGQVNRVSFESPSFPGDNTHVYYDYNNAGEMTAVTGSPYAGVTQYVTEMKYRASGWGKSLQYGNNRTLVAGYDSRQQLQSLQLKKPDETKEMDKVYQYYPDGRIKFSDDSLGDQLFDRAFSYDHVGRVQEAWTGIQARNFINQVPIGTDIVPYHLANQYDVWGNRLSQTGKVWSADMNESASYLNNRRSGWQFDATGNVLNDGVNPFQYDAAGRNVSVGSGLIISTKAFDGDGLGVRRDPIELSRITGSNQPTFYVRSTVLGGQVIAEINGMAPGAIWVIPRGGKLLSYVYHGASMVAIQHLVGSPLIQRLEWRQVDPNTGTQLRTATSSDAMHTWHEPDPEGVHVGFSDPAEIPPLPGNSNHTLTTTHLRI